jgi:hypothetical protein
MHAFEETARPVIFEHEDSEYPYWGKGSSFLLANAKHYFWVTAKHVITNLRGTAEALRIFPADKSCISLPFNEQYVIKKGGEDDEEYEDIYVLRIDLSEFNATGDSPLTAQDVDTGLVPAEELAVNDELWIIGYPTESNFIDFEARAIKNTRSVIRAIYKGYSVSEHCHTARIETSVSLSSFDGLSGSPVFYLRAAKVGGQDVQFPMLVGMLLRGTAESKLVHFVSAKVIKELINLASLDA